MTQRHKVFISYHHENDQRHKNKFLRLFGSKGADILVDASVDTGDIQGGLKTETIRQKIRDEYIRDATVVIVLVGRETWKRKHVDWEISSGLRATKNNPRCGLLGILLPTHESHGKKGYSSDIIPPKLHDNIECGFADIYDWSESATKVQNWIHTAFKNRNDIDPDNSRVMFSKNRSSDSWQ